MVPILSGIIVGQQNISTSKAFKLSLSYVLGMAITYALAGMIAGFMGSTLQTWMQRPSVIISFACIFLAMAFSMFGFFDLKLPTGLNRFYNGKANNRKKNYLSVLLMGILSTLVVSPCVTAPLIGVLSYIGQQGAVAKGGLILFSMALGMGVPLLLVGSGYGRFLPKTGAWMLKIKQLFAFVMLGMAVWMLGRILDAQWLYALWAGFFILLGIYLGGLVSLNKKMLLFQAFGLCAFLYAGTLLYQAIQSKSLPSNVETKTTFVYANTLAEINKQLDKAKTEGRMVMIEFFATWCSDCQAMDAKVFNQRQINSALAPLLALKVDVSEKTEEVEQIRKAFAVYGYPTILFFNSKGEKLKDLTGVGFIPFDSMLGLINEVKKQDLS
ncbi:protein-disulfide reductase DsbD [Legionella sp. km772]|uniref:protein-disulfide reductase DsbD n=1 Tax=Legionella sp. km772 TaxID=2498111 RepID=UPI0013158302|nr:protein-disulfide reductase DsbD [Legionella sp. km772]